MPPKKVNIKEEQVAKEIKELLYTKNEYGYEHAVPSHPPFSQEHLSYLKKFGINTEYEYKSQGKTTSKVPIHPMCVDCQARHILRYKDHPNANPNKPFEVICKGVPAELPPGSKEIIKRYITEENIDPDRAKLIMRATVDPVAWAELMFGFSDHTIGDPTNPWYLRWYQKEQLRCSSKRIVIRQGRRTGKTFAMALKLLYYIFNYIVYSRNAEGAEVATGPQILVITPFQSQLDVIFGELEKLIKKNIDLAGAVQTQHAGNLFIKSPFFKMGFSNGGVIKGFVSGVEVRQDGNAGGNIRGQSANILYLDEMDAIHEDIISKVVTPILLTEPNTILLATSTPIGKAGKFKEYCMDRPDVKQDYLPSTVLPHWETEKKETSDDPNDDAFVAEYMASFVENSSGVFKSDDVYSAMKEYTYEDSAPTSSWWSKVARIKDRKENIVTVVGIDWNKNAGSEFVVVSWDAIADRWWVVDAVNVSPGQFNSIRFKEKVRDLNYKWKPDFIYADEGYGHHIIDDLLYEAHQLQMKGPGTVFETQTAKLKDRLKKFNFSQKVELINPIDHTPLEKTGKEFLVENAVRVFESRKIAFPVIDNTLRTQLLNYIVMRRHASNNKPVYGMRSEKIGDHRLDALMLALGGIFLEKNPIYSHSANYTQSLPGLISKEVLEARKKSAEDDKEFKQAMNVPGVNLTMISYIRGGSPEENERIMRMRRLEEQNNKQFARSEHRGDVPYASMKPKSVLEEIKSRAPSYNGYENDTRPIYEAKRLQNNKPSRGGLFVSKRGKTSGRSKF